MADGEKTKGQTLATLRSRSGLSLDAVAREAGYARRSSVQRFFDPNYDPPYIPMDLAQRLAKAFVGKGSPPIALQELLTLAGVPTEGITGLFEPEAVKGGIGSLPRDVPVYGTALAGEVLVHAADGSGSISVEQAQLSESEIIGFLRRPPSLEGRKDIYGIYIAGNSMFPRFHDGEAVFVDPRRPPMVGDDVIVQLVEPDDHDGDRVNCVLIKRLVRRAVGYVELEQFNPALSFRIDSQTVKAIHRIVPSAELLS